MTSPLLGGAALTRLIVRLLLVFLFVLLLLAPIAAGSPPRSQTPVWALTSGAGQCDPCADVSSTATSLDTYVSNLSEASSPLLSADDFVVDSCTGSLSTTYSATAQEISPLYSDCFIPNWWGPAAIQTPTYSIHDVSSTSTGASWTTTIDCGLETSDPYPLTVSSRYQRYLSPQADIQSTNPEIVALAQELTSGCQWESDAQQEIAVWVRANITYDYSLSLPSDALSVLQYRAGVCAGFANLTTALLRAAGLPSDGSVGGLFPGGVHAWNVVLYPSTGWVFSEPQSSLFTVSDSHNYAGPRAWNFLLDASTGLPKGVTKGPQSGSVTAVSTKTYPGIESGYLSAATVTHTSPAQVAPPTVDIESAPVMGQSPSYTLVPDGWWEGPCVRGHVSGSTHAAWATWKLDGRVVGSGGLDVLAEQFPSMWRDVLDALPLGQHTLSLDVEDVWGQVGHDERVITTSTADMTAPTTKVFGADRRWHNKQVTLVFAATDNPAGSGMIGGTAKTEYRVDSGAWVVGTTCRIDAPVDHSNDGIHQVRFASTDAAGNTEQAKSVSAKVDTRGPTTAARAAGGTRGHVIALKYRISDDLSPQVTSVKLVVKDNNGKIVKRFSLGTRTTASWYSAGWKPAARGIFRYVVTAKDLAGNREARSGGGRITVS